VDDALATAFPQAARVALHSTATLQCETAPREREEGLRNITCSSRLSLVLTFSAVLVSSAGAATVAETLGKWGLIGQWSRDCSLPPDRNKGTVLSYETTPDGGVVHRRNFGDERDESEVLSANVSKNGVLNLKLYLPSVKQTREFGLTMQKDGSIRAIYNRDEKHQYSIRDGRFVANGKPTPLQHKCTQPSI
jgi:hypothetical protein